MKRPSVASARSQACMATLMGLRENASTTLEPIVIVVVALAAAASASIGYTRDLSGPDTGETGALGQCRPPRRRRDPAVELSVEEHPRTLRDGAGRFADVRPGGPTFPG